MGNNFTFSAKKKKKFDKDFVVSKTFKVSISPQIQRLSVT